MTKRKHLIEDEDKEGEEEMGTSKGGLAAELVELFGTKDLYEILSVSRESDGAALKKAYRVKALRCHPDKVAEEEKADATRKFQALAKVYRILGDQETRNAYNETGVIDDEDASGIEAPADGNWEEYFRLVLKRVDTKAIIEFEKKYRHSEEERQDVRAAYKTARGDMSLILDTVMCSTVDDEERFRTIIQDGIDSGELKRYKKFSLDDASSRQQRMERAEEEAAEAEKERKRLGLDDDNALAALIRNRGAERLKSLEDSLLGKYGESSRGKKKGKSGTTKTDAAPNGDGTSNKKKRVHVEPSEEEFAAIQARLDAARRKK